jgi:hypothetical protein
MPKSYLALAVTFVIACVVIYFAFVRPSEGAERTAAGEIRSKVTRSGGTYTQYQPGIDRGFRTPTQIPVAEADVFEIALDGSNEIVRYAVNTTSGAQFSVGQRVRVKLIERGLPLVWKRIYVVDMAPE